MVRLPIHAQAGTAYHVVLHKHAKCSHAWELACSFGCMTCVSTALHCWIQCVARVCHRLSCNTSVPCSAEP